MTARLTFGQSARQRASTRAVLPEPTGPATPSVKTWREGPAYRAGPGPVPCGRGDDRDPCAGRSPDRKRRRVGRRLTAQWRIRSGTFGRKVEFAHHTRSHKKGSRCRRSREPGPPDPRSTGGCRRAGRPELAGRGCDRPGWRERLRRSYPGPPDASRPSVFPRVRCRPALRGARKPPNDASTEATQGAAARMAVSAVGTPLPGGRKRQPVARPSLGWRDGSTAE